MPRALIEAFEKDLGVNVLHAWGMTETSPLGTVSIPLRRHLALPENERWDVKAKQGYPVPGIELRLASESGEELPWDGVTMGELQVRGPWVAREYFKLAPEPEHFTRDGWFRTGDVAVRDGSDYRLLGRRSVDIIKTGGYKVSALEIEEVLRSHPAIAECAVVGVEDPEWGQRVAVAVETREGHALTPDALQQWAGERLAPYKVPRSLLVMARLPRNAMGKITKPELAALFLGGGSREQGAG
jgi:acyl-CoA synthetase (AMP-forming)/AMP-acid ligase II